LSYWVAGFGHVDFAFIPEGDLVWLNSCSDEASGDRIGQLASGPCARISPGDDFNGYGIVRVNSKVFPRFVRGRFSGEGGEERVESGFDPVRFRIEVGQEGGVLDHDDAGFWGVGRKKLCVGKGEEA